MTASGLKPINALQAAEADLQRRERNAAAGGPPYEVYAFHRNHVRSAKDPADLIARAARDPDLGKCSAKKNTAMLYGDAELLAAAQTLGAA
jgi:hypothetical protein